MSSTDRASGSSIRTASVTRGGVPTSTRRHRIAVGYARRVLELVPLLTVHVLVDPDIDVGEIPGVGYRRLIPIRGGTFEGERLRGTILDNGADWNTVRSDDTMHFWARYTLLTDDDTVCLVHEHPDPAR